MTNDILTTGNISTFATWIYILISPILVRYGIQIDETLVTTFITALIGIIIAVWSSKNPNTLSWLGNAPTPIDNTEPVLNDEYEYGEDEDGGC